jgi:hypothetical protein
MRLRSGKSAFANNQGDIPLNSPLFLVWDFENKIEERKMTETRIECPECRSKSNWKDGTRPTAHGRVQRYYCRDGGYRFS